MGRLNTTDDATRCGQLKAKVVVSTLCAPFFKANIRQPARDQRHRAAPLCSGHLLASRASGYLVATVHTGSEYGIF
jgi:hypothetical protein